MARGAASETVVCILGAPRSGTSLTARILNICGLYLGKHEELVPAGVGNTAGFWELRGAVRLNERILIAMGGNSFSAPFLARGWEHTLDLDTERQQARELIAEVFGDHRAWGWKDPRNSLTLPFWQQLLPEMRYVICVRNPLDVAESGTRMAASRLELDRSRALELWESYLASAIVNTSGRPRLFVAYEDYFKDWQPIVERLMRFAGLKPPNERSKEDEVSDVVDRGLRHHLTPPESALQSEELPASTRALYLALQSGDNDLDRLAHGMLTGDDLPNGRSVTQI